jgi:hypothetical protein
VNRLFALYFQQLPVRQVTADADLHLLNEREVKVIKQLETKSIVAAALIGAVGVLLLYLPQYYWPKWFLVQTITIPFFPALSVELSVAATVYGIVLVFVEVWLLYLVNLYGAHQIAVAMGLLTSQTKANHPLGAELLQIGLEQKSRAILRYGLDPYQGLSKRSVWLITLLFGLKATLSNVVVKLLLRRVLGRFAVREVMDLAGIPVFAFWNAAATRIVLREARVVIMGQHLIEQVLIRIGRPPLSGADQTLVYDTLQFIAVSKRDFHRNHHYLTERLLTHLGIVAEAYHPLPEDFFDKLKSAPAQVADLCRIIILLGFVLDGELSWRERRRLHELNQEGILKESLSEVTLSKDDFYNGRGLAVWLNRYLPTGSDGVEPKL